MKTISLILLALATLLSCTGFAKDDAIKACLNAAKYPSRRLRGDCLEKTGDVRAIAELHKMALEITPFNLDSDADDFRCLAGNAGEIAAWADYKSLIKMAKSRDMYTQVFAVKALRYMLVGLNTGPREKLKERIARYRASQGDVAEACRPYTEAESEFIRQTAKECLERAEKEPRTYDFPDPKKDPPLMGRPPLATDRSKGSFTK